MFTPSDAQGLLQALCLGITLVVLGMEPEPFACRACALPAMSSPVSSQVAFLISFSLAGQELDLGLFPELGASTGTSLCDQGVVSPHLCWM